MADDLTPMAFAFEVFDKRSTPLVKRPQVTIQAGGSLSLNLSSYHALGRPPAVELLYDREQRVIGFRPVPSETDHAYPIRGAGQKEHPTSFIIAGRAFLAHFDIAVEQSVRRDASVTAEGVLIVDLKAAGRDATSNRSRKRSVAAAAAPEDESPNGAAPAAAGPTELPSVRADGTAQGER